MKNSNVILGVLGGLAIGAIAGVLFAPEKGTKTRKKIKDKAKDVKANLENDFVNFMSKMEEKYESLSENTLEILQEEKDKIEKKTTKIL